MNEVLTSWWTFFKALMDSYDIDLCIAEGRCLRGRAFTFLSLRLVLAYTKKLECIDTIIHSTMYEASRIEGEKPKEGRWAQNDVKMME